MKKPVIIKVILVLLLAVAICPCVATQACAEVSISSGRVNGSTLDENWTLDVGEGYREWVRHVTFGTPFLRTPRVSVSLAQVDNGDCST